MEQKINRWWDLIAILLLWAALGVVSIRLEMTQWTESLGRITLLVMISLWLGVLLGRSRFKDSVVFIFTILYSLFFITWQLGLTLGEGVRWSERLLSLSGRLWQTWVSFINNQPIHDPILFLFSMALLFWTTSLLAGFYLVREARPWLPLSAAAIIFFIIDYYNPTLAYSERYSGFFVLVLLLLLGRIYYLQSLQSWREKSVTVDIDTGRSVGMTVLAFGLVLVLLSWNVPVFLEALTPGSAARQRFSQSWEGIRDRFSKITTSLQSPVVYVNDFVGDSLSLGPGSVLGQGLVFSVQPSILKPDSFRYYWRGRSYDSYVNGHWNVAVENRQLMKPGDWPVQYMALNGRQAVDVAVQMIYDGMYMAYVPGMPLYLSRPSTMVTNRIESKNPEVMALITEQILRSGDVFYSRGWVAAPTTNQLQKAGTGYPDWVTSRYLQVPIDLLPEFKALAEEITNGKTTPFDQTVAITQYLRDTITYQKVIPSPPPGQDPIEWFLFDFKKGYCNYYASAEVLLLRSMGIPARMSAGFAQGTYNDAKKEYEIHQDDSHAWPEVYFPGVGWVEFEPTSSQPVLTYLTESSPAEKPSQSNNRAVGGQFNQADLERINRLMEQEGAVGQAAQPQRFPIAWAAAVGLFALLLMVAFLWRWKRWGLALRLVPLPVRIKEFFMKRRLPVPGILGYWAYLSQLGPMQRLYSQGLLLMALFSRKTSPGQTPAENLRSFSQFIPSASSAAEEFLHEIELAIFSQHAFDIQRARKSLRQLIKQGMVKSLSMIAAMNPFRSISRRK